MELFYNIFGAEYPSIDIVGGKGHSLMFTARNGYNVPPGVIISTKFFEKWLEHIKNTSDWELLIYDEKSIEVISEKLKENCDTLEYSEIQLKTINSVKEFLLKEKIDVFAVRSSSPEEDLEGASFAGMYQTVLGVSVNGLEEAIKICFGSAFSENVISYKKVWDSIYRIQKLL